MSNNDPRQTRPRGPPPPATTSPDGTQPPGTRPSQSTPRGPPPSRPPAPGAPGAPPRPMMPQSGQRPVMPRPSGPPGSQGVTSPPGAQPTRRGPPPQQVTSPTGAPRAPPPQTAQPVRPGVAPPRPQAGRAVELPLLTDRMAGVAVSTRPAGVGVPPSLAGASGGSSSGSGGRTGPAGRASREYFIRMQRVGEKVATKKGTLGQPVKLISNYFPLTRLPDYHLNLLSVEFKPDVDEVPLRKELVNQLRNELGVMIYDGTCIYIPRSPVPVDGSFERTFQAKNGQTYHLKLSNVGEVSPQTLNFGQFLNLIIRAPMEALKLVKLRRDLYDKHDPLKLPDQKVEIWPGYKTSIRQHEHQPLLMIDIAHKILKTETVLVELHKITREPGDFQTNVKKKLIGQEVITKYNDKTYRIDDVLFDKCPESKFPKKDGKEISFVDYYLQQYQIKIGDRKQPMLMTSVTNAMIREAANRGRPPPTPAMLVPELCNLTNITANEKSDFRFFKPIQDAMRSDPSKRVERLMRFRQRAKHPNFAQELTNWQLAVEENLVEVEGRVLPPERILCGGNATVSYKPNNAEWQSVFRNKLRSTPPLNQWSIVFAEKDTQLARKFCTEVIGAGRNMGFMIRDPIVKALPDTRVSSYVTVLKERHSARDELVMTLVPNNKGDLYHTIKKACYVQHPMPSQVVTMTLITKQAQKSLGPVATKVAAQMSAKIGGELWALDIPLKTCMVIGYDAYHDSTSKEISVGAIVCSMNASLTKFMTFTSRHKGFQELAVNFQKHVRTAVEKYAKMNGDFPRRIIIYRDGVGFGQENEVYEMETKPIKAMLFELDSKITCTYIIVTKRINTKFFIKGGPAPANPGAGTVVDDVVTLPERYDFFLVSQSVRQGTVNPTGYHVIVDNSGLSPSQLQRFTYMMTHLYFNWPGQVRVPMVCQYAHKCAYLVGESLHADPHQDMGMNLFYL